MPKPETLERKVIEAITEMRLHAGLTYADVADKAGVHRTAVSLIERGERHMTLLMFLKICSALKADPASVFDDIQARGPPEPSALTGKATQPLGLYEKGASLSGTPKRNKKP